MKKFNNYGKSVLVFHYLEMPFSIANLINKTASIIIAEYNPNLPISSAIFYNFICKGVAETYYWFKATLILPLHDKSPTTITTILP